MLVMQTLSKAWGFAGLRLGLGFASVEMISLLNKIKPPYNINLLSQKAAIEGLQNADQVKSWVKTLIAEREILAIEMAKLDFVEKVFPSDANFILVKMENAKQVYDQLLQKLIVVRDRSKVVLCDNSLRISIGTAEENQKLLEALKNL
jgi:histidinol-phosphate aminotransferase